jgi:hypothetical protein
MFDINIPPAAPAACRVRPSGIFVAKDRQDLESVVARVGGLRLSAFSADCRRVFSEKEIPARFHLRLAGIAVSISSGRWTQRSQHPPPDGSTKEAKDRYLRTKRQRQLSPLPVQDLRAVHWPAFLCVTILIHSFTLRRQRHSCVTAALNQSRPPVMASRRHQEAGASSFRLARAL